MRAGVVAAHDVVDRLADVVVRHGHQPTPATVQYGDRLNEIIDWSNVPTYSAPSATYNAPASELYSSPAAPLHPTNHLQFQPVAHLIHTLVSTALTAK